MGFGRPVRSLLTAVACAHFTWMQKRLNHYTYDIPLVYRIICVQIYTKTVHIYTHIHSDLFDTE